ncbi:hypothetical protein LOD99_3186 [Oopsacas minuta]|uniref:Uncharacterized protein n=1 Tax=Oopsacas minuta TaxID=111878 RepID=A0AAV7JXS5_9METZ|nr:hypothetical protein LOD99_3186 [Oopsacas minuta]
MMSRFSIILTVCLLPHLLSAENLFIKPDRVSCKGEEIKMSCYIEPPTGEQFSNKVPLISIDNSEPYTKDQINSNTIPHLDTSGYHIEKLSTVSPQIAASITITSFVSKDSAVLFGCHGSYISGTNTEALASGNAPRQAKVPNQILFDLYVDLISISDWCRALVSIKFLGPPESERAIEYYQVYVDGDLQSANISNDTDYFYPSGFYLDVSPATTYSIGLAAVSCAGAAPKSQDDVDISIPSYELDSNLRFELDYFNSLIINWDFTKDHDIPFAIGYSLKVNTAFKTDLESSVLTQTLNFIQSSAETSYSFDFGLSIIGEQSLYLDITVDLGIVSQCHDDKFAGNIITNTQTSIRSHVAPINIPYKISWIVVVVVSVALAVCTCSNYVSILSLLVMYCEKKRINRRNAYHNLIPEDRTETSAPLLSRMEVQEPTLPAPGYSVNTGTAEQPRYGPVYHD